MQLKIKNLTWAIKQNLNKLQNLIKYRMLKRKFTRNEAYDMKYYENINKLMGGG